MACPGRLVKPAIVVHLVCRVTTDRSVCRVKTVHPGETVVRDVMVVRVSEAQRAIQVVAARKVNGVVMDETAYRAKRENQVRRDRKGWD